MSPKSSHAGPSKQPLKFEELVLESLEVDLASIK
jgi:hypothetical protein